MIFLFTQQIKVFVTENEDTPLELKAETQRVKILQNVPVNWLVATIQTKDTSKLQWFEITEGNVDGFFAIGQNSGIPA